MTQLTDLINGLVPISRQAITWKNADPIHWHIFATTGINLFMMTLSNGNIFRVTGLCAGNSPVTGEFP